MNTYSIKVYPKACPHNFTFFELEARSVAVAKLECVRKIRHEMIYDRTDGALVWEVERV